MPQMSNEPPALLSLNDVAKLTSLSRTAINKRRFTGRFPQAVELDGKRVGFVRSEVEAWIRARITERDGKAVS